MFGEVFNNEIKLKEDECCIVFDFGCYFPYEDADHLSLILNLMDRYLMIRLSITDILINHIRLLQRNTAGD
mgnify:CR=1 FL=1